MKNHPIATIVVNIEYIYKKRHLLNISYRWYTMIINVHISLHYYILVNMLELLGTAAVFCGYFALGSKLLRVFLNNFTLWKYWGKSNISKKRLLK